MTGENGALVGGRYQLRELIGQGGMGRVWRGWDTTLGRDVAVKEVLLPQGVTETEREQLVQRVLREARAAARLNHPGIITVHDVVEHEGSPVIVMEFVTGVSLAAAISRDGALPVARVAAIGAAMVKALQQAHAAGIVHRDLKPDNVLMMGDRVILTDFGIAHMADATTALTRTGAVIGTPAYMAPEQLEGKPPAPANDLWSLGTTLYAAVEGETPFSGETFGALCVAVVTKEPRPPLRADGLTPLLGALLAKDPARRPTAEQALAALEAVALTGVVTGPVRPAEAPTPTAAGGGPSAGGGWQSAVGGGAWVPGQSAGAQGAAAQGAVGASGVGPGVPSGVVPGAAQPFGGGVGGAGGAGGVGAPTGVFGASEGGYGAPGGPGRPGGYGGGYVPQGGYGTPQPGHGAPAPGYGTPPGTPPGSPPSPPGYGAPAEGYPPQAPGGHGTPVPTAAAAAPAATAARQAPHPASAMLVRFIGCMALIWITGSTLPWNYLDRVDQDFVPTALGITAVLALVHAVPRPRWHPMAVWPVAVVADVGLWFLTGSLLEAWFGYWETGFGSLPWQIAVNMLILGTGAWLLWLVVPGSRQEAARSRV
ncbi:serine/threonine-protein kinase [Kitasatospora sp. NBC_00458]|uniref:serine/threonine-protein kinase n=1 Tax=Kitasatospora sp. NBC_00458 TaxID=2903568 RepID=UPI002E18D8EC